MDEIITDAELHEADWCIDARLSLARQMNEENREAQLIHKALLELKIRRDTERTMKSRQTPSSLAARDASKAIS